jgi:hypothetical protein
MVLAVLLGVGGAAAGLSRSVTVCAVAVVAALIGIWEVNQPPPPLSKRQMRKLSRLLSRKTSSRWHRRYVSPYVVSFDDEGVAVDIGGKKREAVRWADLVVVAIRIEDEYLPFPYWILFGRPGKGGCLYPNDAVGARAMLHELQARLPGFDNGAVIKAMGMMSGGVHVWKHPDWEQ